MMVDFLQKKCKSYQDPNTSHFLHSLSTAPVITWKNVRIATPKAQDPDELTKHQTIPAGPPGDDFATWSLWYSAATLVI